jgi:hypothetical protein
LFPRLSGGKPETPEGVPARAFPREKIIYGEQQWAAGLLVNSLDAIRYRSTD